MKYIKLFENFSSEDEDVEAHLAQQYEDEKLSIDDLKMKLIDLLNEKYEKFGGPYCELVESDQENENLFTIISNVGEEKKLEFEIKPYESKGREGYPNYVLHLNSDDISEETKRKFQKLGQWSFSEDRLHYVVDFIRNFLFGVYNK
jgi:hypothetical protein